MKTSRKIVFAILFLLIPFSYVKAADCTNENLSTLKNWASNVNYDYSYVESVDKAIFKLRFTNLNQNIVLKDIKNNVTYSKNNNNEITIDGFEDGKTYSFQLVANDEVRTEIYYITQLVGDKFVNVPMNGPAGVFSCQGKVLNTMYITLPKYNQFYNSEICVENKSNKLCSKWHKHNMSLEEFTKEIEDSKKKETEKEIVKDTNESILDKILNLYKERPVIMFITTTIILGGIIFITMQIIKRNRSGFEGW